MILKKLTEYIEKQSEEMLKQKINTYNNDLHKGRLESYTDVDTYIDGNICKKNNN